MSGTPPTRGCSRHARPGAGKAPVPARSARQSPRPEHLEQVHPAEIFQDQVSDQPGIAEREGSHRRLGIAAMEGITAPRVDLQERSCLGEGAQRLGR